MFKAIVKALALIGLLFLTTINAASQTKDDIAMEEALAAYNSGNLKKAEKIWLELANSGAPAVQHNLGTLYDRDGDPQRRSTVRAAPQRCVSGRTRHA